MSNTTRIEIGKRLKEARTSCKPKITQQQMADRLGISRQAWLDMENGRSAPKSELLNDLSSILGKSINWIISGKDPLYEISSIIESLSDDERNKLIELLDELAVIKCTED